VAKKEDKGGKAQEGVSNAKNEIFRLFGYMKLIIQYRLGYMSFAQQAGLVRYLVTAPAPVTK